MIKPKRVSRWIEILMVSVVAVCVVLGLGSIQPATAAPSSQVNPLAACAEAAFSTEEEFITDGERPADGNLIVSGGDLLSPRGVICMRNRQLLAAFGVPGAAPLPDLGLDATDIIRLDRPLVAFSTELKDPRGRFGAGDLLTTDGAVIPNTALTSAFGVGYDVGLDEIKFIGSTENVLAFLEFAKDRPRDGWDDVRLPEVLTRYKVDIWFSIEETVRRPDKDALLDGDILSAQTGTIVLTQADLLAAPIPAGLPDRGVDFGLDAFSVQCDGNRETVRFSTEIVYQDERASAFTDGDLLKLGGGVERRNLDFIGAFKPRANDLGLDAVSFLPDRRVCERAVTPSFFSFLPMILKQFTVRG